MRHLKAQTLYNQDCSYMVRSSEKNTHVHRKIINRGEKTKRLSQRPCTNPSNWECHTDKSQWPASILQKLTGFPPNMINAISCGGGWSREVVCGSHTGAVLAHLPEQAHTALPGSYEPSKWPELVSSSPFIFKGETRKSVQTGEQRPLYVFLVSIKCA